MTAAVKPTLIGNHAMQVGMVMAKVRAAINGDAPTALFFKAPTISGGVWRLPGTRRCQFVCWLCRRLSSLRYLFGLPLSGHDAECVLNAGLAREIEALSAAAAQAKPIPAAPFTAEELALGIPCWPLQTHLLSQVWPAPGSF